uniref:Uncharacterized protein n=1 Tax=Rhizophora mucronata TaxID=61149 RepID=A0A2P2MHE1_RHIMU
MWCQISENLSRRLACSSKIMPKMRSQLNTQIQTRWLPDGFTASTGVNQIKDERGIKTCSVHHKLSTQLNC